MSPIAIKQMPQTACRKLIPSFILAACTLISGCNDSSIIWSREIQSPNKNLVAIAQTEQYGGFGTDAVYTLVSLKQNKREPTVILSLSNESAYPLGVTVVDMIWVTPTHLKVIYKGHATIEFQAIKCCGVDVSVEKKG